MFVETKVMDVMVYTGCHNFVDYSEAQREVKNYMYPSMSCLVKNLTKLT